MIYKSQKIRMNEICLSFWQWAFVSSVFIVIGSAILTTCCVLAKIHTQEIVQLIQRDLADEEDRREYDFENKKEILTPNEIKLHLSERYIFMKVWIMSICTYIGCVNFVTSILLVYGVCRQKSFFIIPWLLIGGISYLVIVSGLLVAYLDMIPRISMSFKVFSISLACTTIFVVPWYTLLVFYTSLTQHGCMSHYPKHSSTIIQAYGGYMHTIKPKTSPKEKKEIV